jgi:glutamate synthase (NADPH/NADH) small chain
MTWPDWPLKLRTSSSHEEGCERDFAVVTKRAIGEGGKVTGIICARAEWVRGPNGMTMKEVAGSEFELKADLVLLAMGFTGPFARADGPDARDARPRGNVAATTTTTRPVCRPIFTVATCVAASRWSSGPSAKAVSARARSMNT